MYTAFAGQQCLATGTAAEVALAAKAADSGESILIFDDDTGRCVDFDLRGSDEEIVARLEPARQPRGVGRPKLGVVAREVTLLPRHWDWLASQPGGASATLRKLVDGARKSTADRDRVRQAQAAADQFMMAMLGNEPGYEEATRALYAADQARFKQLTSRWPADLKAHAQRLAAPAFA